MLEHWTHIPLLLGSLEVCVVCWDSGSHDSRTCPPLTAPRHYHPRPHVTRPHVPHRHLLTLPCNWSVLVVRRPGERLVQALRNIVEKLMTGCASLESRLDTIEVHHD
ncbi:hypothetical protein E2C01_041681 [Portunus trituberculatus]|uniref:Secreted protein n=1 Tax=Portunus trituberculatus TaxID=210409 RepID=A0A5B7FJV9_PORTR|nr:hypothetical protein [Portunus trituberculatus]